MLNLLFILLQTSTVPIAKDISTMSNASQDQTMLIYVLIVGYGPLITVIGILWRKFEEARKNEREEARRREDMIQEHNRQMQAVLIEKARTDENIGKILAKLDHAKE